MGRTSAMDTRYSGQMDGNRRGSDATIRQYGCSMVPGNLGLHEYSAMWVAKSMSEKQDRDRTVEICFEKSRVLSCAKCLANALHLYSQSPLLSSGVVQPFRHPHHDSHTYVTMSLTRSGIMTEDGSSYWIRYQTTKHGMEAHIIFDGQKLSS